MFFPCSPAVFRLMLTLAFLAGAGVSGLRAQDRLVFKDNPSHIQDGRITGMNGNTVQINVATTSGAGQMAFDLGLIARIDSSPPAAFQAGSAAYAAGQWDKALASLKPLVDTFHGLPTDWERQAIGMLGDIYIEKNDVVKAEAAYGDYRRFYPGNGGGSLRVNVGQARLSLARNNAAQARQQLDPIRLAALRSPAEVSSLDGAAYGQAFNLSGQLYQREGNFQAALEDYLRTVTLFYQDGGVAARAQASADALRAAHKDLSAP